jgi:hypothetical protein
LKNGFGSSPTFRNLKRKFVTNILLLRYNPL